MALTPTASGRADAAVVSDAGIPGTMVEGNSVRFSVPAEGTLQFLPGRLEIGSGFDAGREIRFVQVPGPDGTDITFGRNEGALYRHIQLRDQTVSRQHAVLQWREGRWSLRNLSHTNPVAHNGAMLDTLDAPCLQDGDRIEMGEVIFTFRSR
ncbi:FHA domain-containing protein [Gemmatimonas sp.]|uniref:FHA domain-containing protein n=1 Tax=Gemmatimonas sp. TaxID=1962908 RepID=UPI00356B4797